MDQRLHWKQIDGRRVKETRVHMKLPSEGKAKGQFFLVTSEMFSFSKNYFLITLCFIVLQIQSSD